MLNDRVQTIIPFCCFVLWAAVGFPAVALADTIVLKSGTRIVADSVTERNGRVEYTIGDNTLTIPKSIVVKIETGPPIARTTAASSQVSPEDLPAMREEMPVSEELISRVIQHGQVEVPALKAVEAEGVAARSAAAYAIAAGFEENRGNLERAASYLQSALEFMPSNPILLENYASLLLRLRRFSEALWYAEQAAHGDPPSAVAFSILGYAYYKNDRNQEAISALKESLKLHADDKVQQLLDRVQREAKTEADFREQESSHFTLRYEGSQTNDALRRQILDSLEESYSQLQSDLGASPRNIFVSLYTDEAFFDVTRAPAWSSALNDGKIRIPISGVNSVTPELARVLRHELTHSFVAQMTHGHVPQWLNEGIAELEEGNTISTFGNRLATLYGSGHQVPLNMLESNFETMDRSEALVAYAESLAAVEYIRATYGISDLARILGRLGEGESIEAALRSTIHSGYKELDDEITSYLKSNYGT
jgi:tetratricopeptide (TPR) repeat protein